MKYSVPDHQEEYQLNTNKHTEIGYPGGKSVKVYNTSFVLLNTIGDIDPKYVFQKGGNNNFFIIFYGFAIVSYISNQAQIILFIVRLS